MHRARISILQSLRRGDSARFSQLNAPTALASADFKFHLRALVEAGYVEKLEPQGYRLSSSGKEFANNLDRDTRAVQKQPKLSVMLVVPKPGADYAGQLLFQQRLRNPYYGYWGMISGPVKWGEPFEAAGRRELAKQAGLEAEFEVKLVCRVRDFQRTTAELLEDKVFMVLQARNVRGELSDDWTGGHDRWAAISEMAAQENLFGYYDEIFAALASGQTDLAIDAFYAPDDY